MSISYEVVVVPQGKMLPWESVWRTKRSTVRCPWKV